MFILNIELLAIRLRQNQKIRGIKIGLQEILLSLFADDLALMIEFNQQSWNAVVSEFEDYQSLTTMKINYNKSTVYRIGSLHNSNARFYSRKKLVWTNEPIKILGILIANDRPTLLDRNFDPLLEKTKALTKIWAKRSLSLNGKIQVINSLIISLYVYRLSVLPNPSPIFFKTFDQIIKEFLWNGKRPKIKTQILYGLKDQGGARLISLVRKNSAIKNKLGRKTFS